MMRKMHAPRLVDQLKQRLAEDLYGLASLPIVPERRRFAGALLGAGLAVDKIGKIGKLCH